MAGDLVRARAGLLASFALWLISLPVLGVMMRLNETVADHGLGRDLRSGVTSLRVAVILYGFFLRGCSLRHRW